MFYTLKGKCGKARVMLLPMQGYKRGVYSARTISNILVSLKVCAMRQEGLSEE